MATYSFLDVQAAITGTGGSINLGANAGVAEEGITIEAVADANTMTIGADGSGMHSLSANTASTVTIRLLKTSPTNAQLMQMYQTQRKSSAAWGKNTITVRDVVRGDNITLTEVAFKKVPSNTYAKEGGNLEWTFDAINTNNLVGTGIPSLF